MARNVWQADTALRDLVEGVPFSALFEDAQTEIRNFVGRSADRQETAKLAFAGSFRIKIPYELTDAALACNCHRLVGKRQVIFLIKQRRVEAQQELVDYVLVFLNFAILSKLFHSCSEGHGHRQTYRLVIDRAQRGG